ncbi:MAG: HAD family hydrolase [Nanoarchaeota archaeon]
MSGTIVVDFSGTLIKPFVVEEANLKRYEILNIEKPGKEEHKKLHATKKHYDVIREKISSWGIEDNMEIYYVQNYGDEVKLSGKDLKTIIMTDLFRDCMYRVANEYGQKIYTEGMIYTLGKIQERGYKIAIVSGIRKDILTGVLAITKCPLKFDYIYGQDPVLSKDNMQLNEKLSKIGSVKYIIGDKLSDLEPALGLDAKGIFFKGGHSTGGEEKRADYSIDLSKELMDIIN